MKEIQRISVIDAVVDNIRDMIESGTFQVGDKLPTEAAFCEMMKVSRASVREALRVLQALCYVEIRPGKGTFVGNYHQRMLEMDWHNGEDIKFHDFMEVRSALEDLSVRLSVDRATGQQVHKLEEIHARFQTATREQDFKQMIMLDELFHSKIVKFTNNQLLINLNNQLLKSFRVYRGSSFTNAEVYKNALEPHARILANFKAKDAAQAAVEMKRHMEITSRDMEKIHSKRAEEKPGKDIFQ